MSLPLTLESEFELVEEFTSGKVFQCYHVRDIRKGNTEAVVRLLPEKFAADQSIVNRFHDFFSRFNDIPNRRYIPSVYSVVGVAGKDVYVVEEYCAGVSLNQFVEKNRKSETFIRDVTEILARVCEALHHAHQKTIYHLCVLPSDVLIDEHDYSKVKLVGFGAQLFAEKGRIDYLSDESRRFIAPEVFKKGVFGPKADVYSLAMTIKELLPEFSQGSDILNKALSTTLKDRFASARQFASNIKELAIADPVADPTPKVSKPINSKGGLQLVLRITTDPEGAEVSTNGKLIGTTSASGLMVPWKPGTVLEIRKPAYATETLDLSTPPDNTEIVVKLSSALTLYTNPWGASVKVNGVEVGIARRGGLVVPWDGATIEIQKAGYKTEIVKFALPPKEQESCVELQPMVSSVAPKRHPLEVVGYAIGAIVLWLLPLVIYSGLSGSTRSSDVHAELLKELNDKRSQISSLKRIEGENERLTKENLATKAEAERLRKEYYAQNQIIASKDKEIASLKQKPPDTSKTVQDELTQLLKLAGSGDPVAQAELGNKYYKGEGVTRDYFQAFEWYKKSAEKGNANAQGRLGWMYDSGLGVGKDKTEAVKWYQKAAQQGDFFAENKLRTALSIAKQSQSQTTAGAQKPVVGGKNSFQPAQYSDLFSASSNGDQQAVERFLARGVDVNARNNSSHTALMLASVNGHYEVVKALLKSGADKSIKSRLGWTALDFAREYNHPNIVTLLNTQSGGLSPAPSASAKTSNDNLDMELISAASNGKTLEVSRLLNLGANPNTKNRNGHTSLMLASYYEHPEVVKTLLNFGADKNLTSHLGWTALDFAKKHNHNNIISLLSQHTGGQTPSSAPTGKTVTSTPNSAAQSMIPSSQTTNKPANPAKDKELFAAARSNDPSIVSRLLLDGANINARDADGLTPLMFAAYQGNYPMVNELLHKGADPNLGSNTGKRALMFATQNGHESVVKLLIEKGANVNDKTDRNETALTFAVIMGYNNISNLLRKYGAKD